MKIYVVTSGSLVHLATGNRGQAEAYILAKAGKYDGAKRSEIRAVGPQTWEAYYVSGRTNRWNRSDYVITELEEGVSRW